MAQQTADLRHGHVRPYEVGPNCRASVEHDRTFTTDEIRRAVLNGFETAGWLIRLLGFYENPKVGRNA